MPIEQRTARRIYAALVIEPLPQTAAAFIRGDCVPGLRTGPARSPPTLLFSSSLSPS